MPQLIEKITTTPPRFFVSPANQNDTALMDTSFLTLRRLRSLRLNSLLFGCGLVVALRSLRRRVRSGVLAGEPPRRSRAAPLPTTRTRSAHRQARTRDRAQEDSKI